MSVFRKDINEVFTPRAASVNQHMYVARPYLERAVADTVTGSMHALLFGESGNGKSWLYKTVLNAKDIPFVVVNCTAIAGLGSFAAAILSSAVKPGTAVKVSYEETTKAGVKVVVAEGGIEHKAKFDLQTSEPLHRALSALSKRFGKRRGVVVLDNLEAIFNSERLMEEVANAIILLDDEAFAEHNIRFLFVGTPAGVLQYFEKTPHRESVSNRLRELPKVGSFDKALTGEIVKRGLREFLHVDMSDSDLTELQERIYFVTMGVAQRIHELCEMISLRVRDNGWRYTSQLLGTAEDDWLKMGFRDAYVTVESHLNSRRTDVSRRNQVIFAIGCCDTHQFDKSKISALINEHFPTTVPDSGEMGIGNILSELCQGATPLLNRAPKSSQYRVRDPRLVTCIRVVIHKSPDGRVVQKSLQLT